MTILDELYRAESKGQVYGSIHSFIHSNPTHTSDISKNVFSFLLRCEHICMFGLQNSYATTMGAILGSLLRTPVRSGLSETTKQISEIEIVLDRFHYPNHIDDWCKRTCNPNNFEELRGVSLTCAHACTCM